MMMLCRWFEWRTVTVVALGLLITNATLRICAPVYICDRCI